MIVGIGTDIIEIKRIKKAIENYRFLSHYFTQNENKFFDSKKNNVNSISGNFAGKEAVSKMLGTGFRKFSPIDIEILRDKLGSPYVVLYGEAKLLAHEKKITSIYISISHCIEYAVAYCIAES